MRPKLCKDEMRQRRCDREGRGTGHRQFYRPYIQIGKHEFPSKGRSHLQLNTSLGRQHHLLSDLELQVFLAVWSIGAYDIREQFPLSFDRCEPEFLGILPTPRGTVEIAEDLGIRHPRHDITRNPRRMTTDFLVDAKAGQFAIHAKYRDELDNPKPRAVELRAVEEQYWRERGVRYIIADEHVLQKDVARWMSWAIEGVNCPMPSRGRLVVLQTLDRIDDRLPMIARLERCAARLAIPQEAATLATKGAILRRLWKPEWTTPCDLSIPWRGQLVHAEDASWLTLKQ